MTIHTTQSAFGTALSKNAIIVSRVANLTDPTAQDLKDFLSRSGVTGPVAFDPAFPVARVAPSASRDLQPRLAGTQRSNAGFQVLPDHLADLTATMQAGNGVKKAVVLYSVETDSGDIMYVAVDGTHRINASIDLGRRTIEAVVLPVSVPLAVAKQITRGANNWLNGRRNSKADENYTIIEMYNEGKTTKNICAELPGINDTHVRNVVRKEAARLRTKRLGLSGYAGVPGLSDDTKRALGTIADNDVYAAAVKLAADAAMKSAEATALCGAIRGLERAKALREIAKRRTGLAPVIQKATGGKSAKSVRNNGVVAMQKAAAAAQHAHTVVTSRGLLAALPTPSDQAQALQAAQDMARSAKTLERAIRDQMKQAAQ